MSTNESYTYEHTLSLHEALPIYATARILDIAHHLAQGSACLDVHCVILPESFNREGMLVGTKRARGWWEGRKLGFLGRAFGIGGQPAHAIIVEIGRAHV